MELQLVSFEQAEALKELGFPQLVNENIHCQYVNGLLDYCEDASFLEFNDNVIYAPTLELAAKWLRDEKGLYYIESCLHGIFIPGLISKEGTGFPIIEGKYTTHEEALSAGIDKALEILKMNNCN